jgi:guanylate kinase
VEGVKQVRASGFPARYVFIAPPSEEELEKRLRGRGTETEASIQKRLQRAKAELDYSKVPGVHDRIIVNDVSRLSCFARHILWYLTGPGFGNCIQGA